MSLTGWRVATEPYVAEQRARLDEARCTYTGWWVDDYCCEPVVMAPTGRTSDDNEACIELTELRCTEPALANGRCSVHMDMGDGPDAH